MLINYLHFSVQGATRVTRGCGWLGNDEGLEDRTCFKRTGTKEVRANKH
jgi:hypothetical protein